MSFIDDCAQLIECEGGYIVQYPVTANEVTAIGINLDPIGAETDLLADCLARLIRAIHQLNTMRHLNFRTVALKRVRACYVHGARGDLHARAGNDAVVDGFLEIGVGVAGALGFEVADGGESVIEGAFYGSRAENSPVR